MAWSGMVDMEMDVDSQLDAPMPYTMPDKPDYPYGLRICLTCDELKKLGLEADCEIGEELEFRARATVTSVTKTDSSDGPQARVELQICCMEVNDEGD